MWRHCSRPIAQRFFDQCKKSYQKINPPAFNHIKSVLYDFEICTGSDIRQSPSGVGVFAYSPEGISKTIGRRYGYVIPATQKVRAMFDLPECYYVVFVSESKTLSNHVRVHYIFVCLPLSVSTGTDEKVSRLEAMSYINVDSRKIINNHEEMFDLFSQFEKKDKKNKKQKTQKRPYKRRKTTLTINDSFVENPVEDTVERNTPSPSKESVSKPDQIQTQMIDSHPDKTPSDLSVDENEVNMEDTTPHIYTGKTNDFDVSFNQIPEDHQNTQDLDGLIDDDCIVAVGCEGFSSQDFYTEPFCFSNYTGNYHNYDDINWNSCENPTETEEKDAFLI